MRFLRSFLVACRLRCVTSLSLLTVLALVANQHAAAVPDWNQQNLVDNPQFPVHRRPAPNHAFTNGNLPDENKLLSAAGPRIEQNPDNNNALGMNKPDPVGASYNAFNRFQARRPMYSRNQYQNANVASFRSRYNGFNVNGFNVEDKHNVGANDMGRGADFVPNQVRADSRDDVTDRLRDVRDHQLQNHPNGNDMGLGVGGDNNNMRWNEHDHQNDIFLNKNVNHLGNDANMHMGVRQGQQGNEDDRWQQRSDDQNPNLRFDHGGEHVMNGANAGAIRQDGDTGKFLPGAIGAQGGSGNLQQPDVQQQNVNRQVGQDGFVGGNDAVVEESAAKRRYTDNYVKNTVKRISLKAREEMKGGSNQYTVQGALIRQIAQLEALIYSLDTPVSSFVASKRASRGVDTVRSVGSDTETILAMCEETRSKFLEHRRAFDELLEEKQSLTKMLKDDERTLQSLQERAQNPALSKWLESRAARLNNFFETPETDAVAYYAGRFMKPKLQNAREGISAFEHRVERTMESVLPARYGSVVALILTLIIVGLPVVVTVFTVCSLSKMISYRQHVLLGNLFLASFTVTLGIVGLVLRQDPLRTLYDASEIQFIVLQFFLAGFYVCFLMVLIWAVFKSVDRRDALMFAAQFIFHVIIAANYHNRVWAPSMLGLSIDTNAAMYLVYTVDFCAMTLLTISSAIPEDQNDSRLPRHTSVRSNVAAKDRNTNVVKVTRSGTNTDSPIGQFAQSFGIFGNSKQA